VKKFIATHFVMEGVTSDGSSNEFNTGMTTYYGNGKNGTPATADKKPSLSVAEMEAAESLQLSGKYNSLVIAKNLSMDISLFNRYNPQFDEQLAANGQYELILPADKMQLFQVNKYQILNESVQLLLGDANIPTQKTNYPPRYTPKGKKKGS
jgi:membrane-bound lytic murein transglycosylase D